VHYKENGEMATIRVDGVGVANYKANQKIEAEDFFKAEGIKKQESNNGFVIKTIDNKSYLNYTNVTDIENKSKLIIKAKADKGAKFSIKILKDSLNGELIGFKTFLTKNSIDKFSDVTLNLRKLNQTENIYLIIEQLTNNQLKIDSFSFSK
jgi:hypothetical protein